MIPFTIDTQRAAVEARLDEIEDQLATIADRHDKLIEERRDLEMMLRSLPEA